MERTGIEVAVANDGAEALEQFARQRPDIVFMDVRMPIVDGLTAVSRLRELWPEEKVVCVAITASGLLREPSYYLNAGFDDFIGKPFLFDTVCDCIAHHLQVEIEREPPGDVQTSAKHWSRR